MFWTLNHQENNGTLSQRSTSITPSQQEHTTKEYIKAKVAYEWKTIFKNLTRKDFLGLGSVTQEDFEKVC